MNFTEEQRVHVSKEISSFLIGLLAVICLQSIGLYSNKRCQSYSFYRFRFIKYWYLHILLHCSEVLQLSSFKKLYV